ncbi:hypothetical protein [Desulfobacter hydrogenophilus]|nr:hypothetical protein [Desulfobacter hydrogenophilus]NDY72254.1 hypothetical protein [Desulfobacter hydrogenophilus]
MMKREFLSFIQLLSTIFKLSNNSILISQSVKKFITEIDNIKSELNHDHGPSENPIFPKIEKIEVVKKETAPKDSPELVQIEKGDLYSKFLGLVKANRLKVDELLLLHYIIDTSRVKLMTGWQEENEVSNITEWEKINDIKDVLSKKYPAVLNRFELRGFTEVSAITSYGNPKEVKIKDEIASNILDLPNDVLLKIEAIVKDNFYEHMNEVKEDDGFPF